MKQILERLKYHLRFRSRLPRALRAGPVLLHVDTIFWTFVGGLLLGLLYADTADPATIPPVWDHWYRRPVSGLIGALLCAAVGIAASQDEDDDGSPAALPDRRDAPET